MRQSLHKRLLFWQFSVAIVSTVMVMILFIHDANRRVAEFRLSHAINQTTTLSDSVRDSMVTEDYENIHSLVTAILPDETYAFASLVLANGQIISHSNIDRIGEIDAVTYSGSGYNVSISEQFGRAIQVVMVPITIADETLGYAKVAIYVDTNQRMDSGTIQSIVGIVVLMITILVVGSYFVTRQIVKPLDKLTSIISTFDIQREELCIDTNIWDRKDEVGELARAYKLMQMDVVEHIEKLRVEHNERTKAESANKSKSDFLANMSHELRTPLNAIIGYSEMLMEEAADNGDADAVDLEKIRSSGVHLLNLINNLLDLSKIEAGRMELDCRDLYFPDLINEVSSTISTQIAQNNNRLIVNIDKAVGHGCLDSTKVRQILYNLLSNASKFSREGEIELNAYVESLAGAYNYVIEVKDQGIGMNREQCEKIFSPYVQAESSTTRNFGGTGLGLTITKMFCELMQGSISVSSEVGVGSVFKVVIPIKTMRRVVTA